MEYKIIGKINTIEIKEEKFLFTLNNKNKYCEENSSKDEYNLMIEYDKSTNETINKRVNIINSKLYTDISIISDSEKQQSIILESKKNSYNVEIVITETDDNSSKRHEDVEKYNLKSIKIL